MKALLITIPILVFIMGALVVYKLPGDKDIEDREQEEYLK